MGRVCGSKGMFNLSQSSACPEGYICGLNTTGASQFETVCPEGTGVTSKPHLIISNVLHQQRSRLSVRSSVLASSLANFRQMHVRANVLRVTCSATMERHATAPWACVLRGLSAT